ncbi:hypothetical protein K523DRAFT_252109, partial [Schizophyllum commune Tattone D]
KASFVAIVAKRMSMSLPDAFISDEELLRWLVPPTPGDASHGPHERAGFVLGHDDGGAFVELAVGEECDEERVSARANTRQGFVRRSICLDAAAKVGIQCCSVLEVVQRYDVVFVFSFRELLDVVSAPLEFRHCNKIEYLQEMLARPNVGDLVVLGHLIHGVQNFLRGHQGPLEVLQRRDHVFTDCEKG